MARTAITRVVVGLDAVSDSRAAIEASTELALRWHAKLHGVFVEDQELLRLAALPFTRQVSLRQGQQALDARTIEDEFRVFARHARQLLADAAEQHRLDWSFQIIRDGSTQSVGEAGDFIVVTADARPFAEHVRLPSRRPVAAPVHQPILMLRGHGKRPRHVVAMLPSEPRESDIEALSIAAELAAFGGGGLTVLGAAGELASRLLRALAEQLGIALKIEPARAPESSLGATVARLGGGMLALGPGAATDAANERDAQYDLLFLP